MDIQPSQPQNNFTPSPANESGVEGQPRQPGPNKKLIAAAIIVFVLLAIGAGAYYWQTTKTPVPVACTQEAKQCPDGSYVSRTGPNCEFAACPDATKDWQTYRDEYYGFEVKYPNTWFTKRCGTYFVGFSYAESKLPSCEFVTPSPHISISIVQTNSMGINYDIKNAENNVNNSVKTDVMLGGNLATKITGKTKESPAVSEGLKTTVIITSYKGNTYQLKYIEQDGKDYSAIFDQMLPSFKFTSSDPTASWQTYRNEEYGFSLTFPKTWEGYTVKERTLNWGNFGTSPSLDFGFLAQQSLFNISILSKNQWTNINSEPGAKPTFINQNDNYVFAYGPAQDAANDQIGERMTEINQILSTFKFIK